MPVAGKCNEFHPSDNRFRRVLHLWECVVNTVVFPTLFPRFSQVGHSLVAGSARRVVIAGGCSAVPFPSLSFDYRCRAWIGLTVAAICCTAATGSRQVRFPNSFRGCSLLWWNARKPARGSRDSSGNSRSTRSTGEPARSTGKSAGESAWNHIARVFCEGVEECFGDGRRQ